MHNSLSIYVFVEKFSVKRTLETDMPSKEVAMRSMKFSKLFLVLSRMVLPKWTVAYLKINFIQESSKYRIICFHVLEYDLREAKLFRWEIGSIQVLIGLTSGRKRANVNANVNICLEIVLGSKFRKQIPLCLALIFSRCLLFE